MAIENTIRLRDGRKLGYGEWGRSDGKPVLGFPGAGLCHLTHYGDEAPAAAGVRLVMPDRPGLGLSDFDPESTHLDWARDVGELADTLGIDRFAVFGTSAGGPSALACAFVLRERVGGVGLVSAVGPYQDETELLPFLPESRRKLVEFARRDPEAAEAAIRKDEEEEVAQIVRDPESFLDSWPPGTPDSDQRVMSDPVIRARFIAAWRELGRRGPEGAIRDTLLNYAKPWGFSVTSLTVPAYIWHGERDSFVPVEVARFLANRIPDARLTVYPGEGHAIDYPHILEILLTLAACVR